MKALRSARWKCINNILLIVINENNTKRFWKCLKSTRQENIRVALYSQNDGELTRDIKDKAEILNDQFKLVFTLDKENSSSAMAGPKYPQY